MQNWQVNKDGKLERVLELENFREVIDFVNKISEVAEKADHHPDLEIFSYKKLRITLFSHKEGQITDRDYALAKQIDKLLDLWR